MDERDVYEHVVYKIGTLTGDAAEAYDRLLVQSFQTIAEQAVYESERVERKARRAVFERERVSKQHIALDALKKSRLTPWYQRWAHRIDRSKYLPGACQRAGKS